MGFPILIWLLCGWINLEGRKEISLGKKAGYRKTTENRRLFTQKHFHTVESQLSSITCRAEGRVTNSTQPWDLKEKTWKGTTEINCEYNDNFKMNLSGEQPFKRGLGKKWGTSWTRTFISSRVPTLCPLLFLKFTLGQGKEMTSTWPVWLSLFGSCSTELMVTGSIHGQGTCLGCGLSPWSGHRLEATDECFSLTCIFLFPLFSSL